MKRILMLCLFAVLFVPLSARSGHAQTADVPLLSASRLSFGFGVEKYWRYESFDVGTQVDDEWYAALPFSYGLPTSIPSAIVGRAEKSITSRNVGFRLGLTVVIFKNGAWTVGE